MIYSFASTSANVSFVLSKIIFNRKTTIRLVERSVYATPFTWYNKESSASQSHSHPNDTSRQSCDGGTFKSSLMSNDDLVLPNHDALQMKGQTVVVSKQVEGDCIKHNYDTHSDRRVSQLVDYKRTQRIMSPNITHEAIAKKRNDSGQNIVTYDQDYDEFYLHMTPTSPNKQDHERLWELELIHHDDVGFRSESSISKEISSKIEMSGVQQPNKSPYRSEDEERQFEADDDFVEFEEDWEIMYNEARKTDGDVAHSEVLDNVDDVNDVVW